MQTIQEAATAWLADKARFEDLGAHLPGVTHYLTEAERRDYTIAMDAQPGMQTDPNSGIPSFLTTSIDPAVFKVLFAPNKAAQIVNEVKKGNWLDETTMFPVVEHTGEVSSYGDFSENGHAGANTNWPQRQSYLYQTIEEYGERELERAGLGRINWVNELDMAAVTVLNKFQNLTYFFGVGGLQNYGLVNDPNLSAALTPALKAYGGNKWINNGVVVATANEIYADIQSLFSQLVTQTAGLVEAEDKMVLAMSPGSQVALTATNSFNVNVADLLKKNFPNIRIETAIQYQQATATQPQGIAGGNMIQLIADSVEGQDAGYAAYNEKLRSHAIVKGLSSFKQKKTGGTWGTVIRMPICFAQMIGV